MDISIYPNPNSGIFKLINSTMESVSISVFDHLGRLVLNKLNANGQSIEIDISSEPKGIYLLKVYREDESISKEIINRCL